MLTCDASGKTVMAAAYCRQADLLFFSRETFLKLLLLQAACEPFISHNTASQFAVQILGKVNCYSQISRNRGGTESCV